MRALLHIVAILASALLLAWYSRVERPWPWLGWIALVPWLAALARENSLRLALLSGTLMSMAFAVGVFGWFADAFARYTQTPVAASYALLIAAAPLLQPQLLVFAGVLVQANLGDYDDLRARLGTFAATRGILDAHMELSREALQRTAGMDLILWPETVYPTTFGAPKSAAGADLDRALRRADRSAAALWNLRPGRKQRVQRCGSSRARRRPFPAYRASAVCSP